MQKGWSKLCFKTALLPCFFCSSCMVRIFTNKKKMDKFGFYFGAYLWYFLWFILGPDWLQKGQDDSNRVIRSYKDQNYCVFKNFKKPSFFYCFWVQRLPQRTSRCRRRLLRDTWRDTQWWIKNWSKSGQKVNSIMCKFKVISVEKSRSDRCLRCRFLRPWGLLKTLTLKMSWRWQTIYIRCLKSVPKTFKNDSRLL